MEPLVYKIVLHMLGLFQLLKCYLFIKFVYFVPFSFNLLVHLPYIDLHNIRL